MPQELKWQELFKLDKSISFTTMKACVHEATATACNVQILNRAASYLDCGVFLAVENVLTVGVYDNVKQWLIFQRSIMSFLQYTKTSLMC